MNAPDHCRVCPFAINEMRKTAIMIGALESIGTPEARQKIGTTCSHRKSRCRTLS